MRTAYRMVRHVHGGSTVSEPSKSTDDAPEPETVKETVRDLVRAAGGGLFIGLPLLFTMEMWQHSFLLPSWKIVVLLAVAFLAVIGYSAVSGFRRERSWLELLIDSVETMGIAAVVAAVALLLLGRIDLETGLRDAVGKVALEMIPVAFGVSLAGSQMASPDDDRSDAANQGSSVGDGQGVNAFAWLVIAAGGALVFALTVAPTEEPMLLGVEAEWWLLLLVIPATLAMTFAIVFYADFRGGRPLEIGDSPLDRPLTETLAAYAVSLVISLLLLWAFGRTDGVAVPAIIGQMIMLGVVASFGAAAGRLLVGSGQYQQESS